MTEADWSRFAAVGGLDQFARNAPGRPLAADTREELPSVTLTVYGHPAPQGSKRAFALRKNGVLTGKAAVIESSHDRVKSWRQAVVDEARSAMTTTYPHRVAINASQFPLCDPVTAVIVFSLRRPKSHYRTGANSHLLTDRAPARPGKAPDLSKLCRATEDALEEVGLLDNDSLIVEYERLAKVWCGEDPDALDVPGAVITIRQVT